MSRGKRYTNEELMAARKYLEAIDYEKYGALAIAAEKAYFSKEFPGRTLSGLESLMGNIREMIRAEKAEQERTDTKQTEAQDEQVMFYCTATVSEQVLREKHDAEKALLLLKRSIIDDALGIRYDELKFCLKSIERAAKFVWPDEYAARLSELYGEEDYK